MSVSKNSLNLHGRGKCQEVLCGLKIAQTKSAALVAVNMSAQIRGGMTMKKRLGRIVFALVFLMLPVSEVFAGPMLAWDASSGEVTGYRIYYGTTQGTYNQNKDVGNVTQYSLSSLPLTEKQTYFFVARAYNSAGESGNSNVVNWTAPDSTAPMPPQGVTVK
jgi:predicted phage tail protein